MRSLPVLDVWIPGSSSKIEPQLEVLEDLDEKRLDKPIPDPETKSSEFNSDGFVIFESFEGGFEFFPLEMTAQNF